MSHSKTDPSETFAADVTDGVQAVLRAAIESTAGPALALAAVTVALTALRHYAQHVMGPNSAKYIEAFDVAAAGLPAHMGARLVDLAIDAVQADAARSEAPTSFYGEA